MASELGAFIRDEVSRAEADLASFRSRAITVVGLAGALVTIVAGAVSLGAIGANSTVSPCVPWLIGVALACFVASVVFALTIQTPVDVSLSKASELQGLVDDHWDEAGWDQSVASVMVEYLVSLRSANKSVSTRFAWSLAFETAGIVLVGAAALVLISGTTG